MGFNKMWGVMVNLIINLNLSSNFWVISGQQQVPCYFIFGDSLNDNGNNNNLRRTTAKANYAPYGIDFAEGPVGRFTNGRNVNDFIAELLGFNQTILSYATPTRKDILKGRNYASGGAGIRQETGINRGTVISMDGQLGHHRVIVSQISYLILKSILEAKKYLNKCMYTVSIGNNDYLNNYFMPKLYRTSRRYTPDQYADVLIQQFSRQLRDLHSYGARKVAIFGLGPIGCSPAVVASSNITSSPCVDDVNNAIQFFNSRLKLLVDNLNGNFTDAKFTYIDSFRIALTGPSSYTNTNTSCCEYSSADSQCIRGGKVCANRDDYAWWDGVHPTETGHRASANRSYTALFPADVYPFDIGTLALLPIP